MISYIKATDDDIELLMQSRLEMHGVKFVINSYFAEELMWRYGMLI